MRASNSARPLHSPFRPGGIAHPLDREDVTLSLVELEPLDDDEEVDLLCTLQFPSTRSDVAPRVAYDLNADFSLEELSIIEDDDVVASCARLSQICPVADDLEELEIEVDDDAGWADDIWVDVSDFDPSSVVASCANPFLVEEPSTFAPGRLAALADESSVEDLSEWLEPLEGEEPESLALDTLDPPTEDLDGLLSEEPNLELAPPPVDLLDPPTEDLDGLLEDGPFAGPPGDGRATARSQTIALTPRRARQRPMREEKTLVLRRSWICMQPGNTNADPAEPTGLSVTQLLQIVRGRSRESHPPVSRAPMPSLPRFPILPPDPRVNPVHIPALRLPRFNVD